MTTEIDGLVLEHLRAIRADSADTRRDIRDVKARFASIESYIATLHHDQTRTGFTIDEIVNRIERLEKRLSLADA
jgi:hypothetical protein